MSYEILNYMSINLKRLTMTARCASSNVRPRHYTKVVMEYERNHYLFGRINQLTDQEAFLLEIISAIQDGSWHLTDSVNKDILYAYLKLAKFMKEKGVNLYEIRHVIHNDGEQVDVDLLRSCVEQFVKWWKSKDIDENFVVELENNTYLYKKRKFGYSYVDTVRRAAVYKSYKEAWIKSRVNASAKIIAKRLVSGA